LDLAHIKHDEGIADIGQDRQSAEAGDNLAQKFEASLAGSFGCLARQAADVAARSRQTRDQAGADRVSSRRENNRDDRRRLLGSQDHASARRDNDINLAPDEFGGDLGRALVASLRPSIFDCERAAMPAAAPPSRVVN
jgi:hypothetical protein